MNEILLYRECTTPVRLPNHDAAPIAVFKKLGVNARPMEHANCCGAQCEGNQAMPQKYGEEFAIPVLHYPQLLGLALGFPPMELGLDSLKVRPTSLLKKLKRREEEGV